MIQEYSHVSVEKSSQVATIRIIPRKGAYVDPPIHWELANIFNDLRADNSIRVIVLTGQGNEFSVMQGKDHYVKEYVEKKYGTPKNWDPSRAWITFMGVVRCHQTMAEIEKPIVAKVNGDATGFGQSLIFSCDLIVVKEDAMICDVHLGMGEMERSGSGFGIVPGDGGCALVPLHMSPVKAKEYLFLAKPYTGKQLAEMGVVNYAVPGNKLDEVTDDMVARLLKRSAYALAWAKRVANRRVVDHLNMTLDSGAAYELVNFLQLAITNSVDKKTLD